MEQKGTVEAVAARISIAEEKPAVLKKKQNKHSRKPYVCSEVQRNNSKLEKRGRSMKKIIENIEVDRGVKKNLVNTLAVS